MNFIARRSKIREAKTCVVAYRLSRDQQENSPMASGYMPNSNVSTEGIMEGYDDGNEEGCGEKLLALL